MENATQFVHGTPKLAASQRTCTSSFQWIFTWSSLLVSNDLPCVSGMSVERVEDQPTTEVPRFEDGESTGLTSQALDAR